MSEKNEYNPVLNMFYINAVAKENFKIFWVLRGIQRQKLCGAHESPDGPGYLGYQKHLRCLLKMQTPRHTTTTDTEVVYLFFLNTKKV